MNTNFLINAAAGFLVNTAVMAAGGKLLQVIGNDEFGLNASSNKVDGQIIAGTGLYLATKLFADFSSGFSEGAVASSALLGSLCGRMYISGGFVYATFRNLDSEPQNSPEAIKSGVFALASTVATTGICLLGLPYTAPAPIPYIIGNLVTKVVCETYMGSPENYRYL
jgi:hypothetical protein